jgi:hypothetical protein
MKGTISIFICLTLLGLYPGISYAGWFGITDYADCIFSGLKNVGSDKAVVAVVSACKQQYPEKPSPGWFAPENYDTCVTIESPCAYAQGIIPATPGYTVLGQLSAKLLLASHVARTIPCGHRDHPRAYARDFVPR